ncbi:MAG: SOS response-associated peptidase [Zetaproteobacteria bacterium]|nr:MAG: SOS response-associated peptidase [Zetaproteobacteria bacterium]
MCGRFSLGSTVRVAQVFDIPNAIQIPPRYNIAPSQDVPAVIRNRETGAREFRPTRWGLVPSWARDPAIGNRLINARAETVATKPAFRRPFRERRCLILADGFYEWVQEGGRKQPYYIRLRDEEPFAFAGLSDRWQPNDAPALHTCAIVTTAPNDLIRRLHDRMPVILPPGDYDLWLDPTVQDVERLQTLLAPYPADAMVAYPVSAKVNNPANDAPDVLEPLAR